ncbi:MAG: MBL fold metallo-hydrolase, partial [Candidatus Aenigmarchaeota archaeon]|nr:MBL fold metallo-hydrolase [Candidatus Aenigmarchaeota archaeon]
MEIKILGSGREVGRSGILVDTGKEKFLWDFGIEVQHGQKPSNPPRGLKGVFLTHAHLDHSGCIPALYKKG